MGDGGFYQTDKSNLIIHGHVEKPGSNKPSLFINGSKAHKQLIYGSRQIGLQRVGPIC